MSQKSRHNRVRGVPILLMVALILALVLFPIYPAQAAFVWSALSGGVNGPVYAIAVDSVNGYIYVGGAFTQAGGVPVNNVARWTGSAWDSMGGGVNGTVYALAIADSEQESIWIGGDFTGYLKFAYPSHGNWLYITYDQFAPNHTIYAIDKTAGRLCIGGRFTQISGMTVGRVACQSGAGVDGLNGGVNGDVRALALDANGNLLLGGSFTSTANGLPAANIVRRVFSSGTWQALGTGLGNAETSVRSIAVDGSNRVYAAYNYTDAFGWGYGSVHRFDGSAWSSITANGWSALSVNTLAWDGRHNLYAGGSILQASGNTVHNIVRFDGNTWSGVGGGTDDAVRAITLAPFYASGYAGGNFTLAGGQMVNRVAQFSDSGLAATETATLWTRTATSSLTPTSTRTFTRTSTSTSTHTPTPTTTHTPSNTPSPTLNSTTTSVAATATAQAGATATAVAATQAAGLPTPTLPASHTPQPIIHTVYLPLLWRNDTSCSSSIQEREPNNTASDTDEVCVGLTVYGSHDGTDGTGDLFKIRLDAGQSLQVDLDTASDTGVQLLLYRDTDGTITLEKQDTTSPFRITYTAPAAGWYLIYVYSDKTANNTANYALHLGNDTHQQADTVSNAQVTPPPAPGQ